MTAGEGIEAQAEAALASLERLLGDRCEELSAEIPMAVRRVAALRDALIGRRRGGKASERDSDWLARTNAILSCVVGAEFPIEGLHRERIRTARDALREMLALPR